VRRIRVAAAATGLASALAGPSAAEPPAGQPPGWIRFVGSNLVSTAEGSFGRWRFLRVEIDPEAPERSVVEIEIDVASLETGIELRDDHLRSGDFFHVERWPHATVRVRDARPDGVGAEGGPRYRAAFEIRIRDVERSLPGHFELVQEEPPTVAGELVLDRREFGVGDAYSRWNPLSVRPEVTVRFRVRLPIER